MTNTRVSKCGDTDSTETFVDKQMASSSTAVSLTLFQKCYISPREC